MLKQSFALGVAALVHLIYPDFLVPARGGEVVGGRAENHGRYAVFRRVGDRDVLG